MRYRVKNGFTDIVAYIFLIVLALICALPFYSMLISATHSNAELASGMPLTIGTSLFANYQELVRLTSIWRWFFNSLLIALPATFLAGYVGSLTAYGFAKFTFRGHKVLFWVVMSTMMIPAQVALLGLFQLSKIYGLLNTYWPLILPAAVSGTSVFWMRSAIESNIDSALLEAARIDGCGELHIFHRIVLPLVKPAFATISIINFVGFWNNYLGPLIILNTDKKYPMALGIAVIKGMEVLNWGVLYTAIAISVIPIMLVFSLLSKHIIGGLTMGSVKG